MSAWCVVCNSGPLGNMKSRKSSSRRTHEAGCFLWCNCAAVKAKSPHPVLITVSYSVYILSHSFSTIDVFLPCTCVCPSFQRKILPLWLVLLRQGPTYGRYFCFMFLLLFCFCFRHRWFGCGRLGVLCWRTVVYVDTLKMIPRSSSRSVVKV